ncbi:replication protein [Clostridium beijerinckii]|nr:replication protein [Clostridium beijerinckii]
MRERKYIRFRVDMYEDTKFKIIDRMIKRDLIHYCWNRLVILAGKVNKEGDLYMSKNIPYTVETLAIEFNRDMNEIKAALDVLIELEMMALTEDKVYTVKNFAKHQNIKIKEKIVVKNKENQVNDAENNIMKNEVQKEERLKNETCTAKNEEDNSKVNKIDVVPLLDYAGLNSDDVNKCDDNIEKEITMSSQHNNSPVILDMKNNKKLNRKNKKASKKKIRDDIIETGEDNIINIMEEENVEDLLCWTTGEDMSLGADEKIVSEWGF